MLDTGPQDQTMTTTRAAPTTLIALAAFFAMPGIAAAQIGGPYDLRWNTIDCGGASSGGNYEISGVIGQPDAGPKLTGASLDLCSGFLPGAAPMCYANCDGTTTPPILNVSDFTCFLNKYGAGDPYANCDGSTVPPILNVSDFACFLNKYSAGCP
jgi:hypothetical protein